MLHSFALGGYFQIFGVLVGTPWAPLRVPRSQTTDVTFPHHLALTQSKMGSLRTEIKPVGKADSEFDPLDPLETSVAGLRFID